MGTGYTRNDTPNNIADGNVINASDLDGEFDAIQAAFNATTGHSHDGTTGEGPQIGTGGIADSAVTTAKINNDAVTLGTKTSGNYVATAGVSGVGLSGSASAEGATFTVTSNATDANTASTIVARDASGNFSAGTITAALTGTASNAALLDSLDSTQFLRSDAADTKTSGDLSFSDNVKAIFGAGSDLQIYHEAVGGESIIHDAGTGNLKIRATNFVVTNSGNSQNIIRGFDGGDVELYYAGSEKLATTSGGIDVTGTVTADGLTVDGSSNIQGSTGGFLSLTRNDTTVVSGNDIGAISFVHEDTDDAGTAALILGSGDGTAGEARISVYTGTPSSKPERLRLSSNGDVSLYDSTGVTQGFYWDASTQRLGLGTTGPSTNLDIAGASATSLTVRNTGTVSSIVLSNDSTANTIYSRGVNATTGRDLRFYQGSSEAVRITSGGNVGIGTVAPVGKLNIADANGDGFEFLPSNTADTNWIQSYDRVNGSWVNQVNAALSHQFHTNGSEKARLDSSGNLLVGKTSDSFGTAGISLRNSGQATFTIANTTALFNRLTTDGKVVTFSKDSTEVGAISTASGRIAIGTNDTALFFNDLGDAVVGWNMTTGVSRGSAIDLGTSGVNFKDLHLSGTAYVDTSVGIGTTSPDSLTTLSTTGGSAILELNRSNTNAGGAVGAINFTASDGHSVANMYAVADGDNEGAHLVFRTTSAAGENDPYGANTFERARIDSSGNLLVAKTSDNNALAGTTISSIGAVKVTRSDWSLLLNRLSTDGQLALFQKDGTTVGSISVTGSGTTYNTTSDIRLKTDIAPIADATDKLMAMNAVTHKWKADPDADAVVGFIAQEMQEIVPEAVSKGEGKNDMWSMDYGRITPVLVAALQDAHKKIEQLEQRIAELEAK